MAGNVQLSFTYSGVVGTTGLDFDYTIITIKYTSTYSYYLCIFDKRSLTNLEAYFFAVFSVNNVITIFVLFHCVIICLVYYRAFNYKSRNNI